MLLDAMRREAAAGASKNWAYAPVAILVRSCLHRLAALLEALAALVRAGGIPALAHPPAGAADRSARKPALPSRFGWLIPIVKDGYRYRSQPVHLLDEPERTALLEGGLAPGGAAAPPALPDAGPRPGPRHSPGPVPATTRRRRPSRLPPIPAAIPTRTRSTRRRMRGPAGDPSDARVTATPFARPVRYDIRMNKLVVDPSSS